MNVDGCKHKGKSGTDLFLSWLALHNAVYCKLSYKLLQAKAITNVDVALLFANYFNDLHFPVWQSSATCYPNIALMMCNKHMFRAI